MSLWVLILVSFLFASARGAVTWTSTPFNPPSFPLAVRTPYLSCWLGQGPGTALNDAWPTFWTGQILGWAGFVNVDGISYSYMGDPAVTGANFTKATQKSASFTATQTTFVFSAGPVDLTVNFLSPVEPDDLAKQSFPFSYLSLSAAATDGGSHSVQVYSDISGEWVSGDVGLGVQWNTTTDTISIIHSVQLQQQTPYSEVNDRIQHGTAYYSTLNGAGVTYQTGADVDVRAQFVKNGKLTNQLDSNFRAVQDNWPVFAVAHDLGSVTSATAPVVVSVGHIRDPVVQYIVSGGALQDRSSYFFSQFSSPLDAIPSFLQDYPRAKDRADALDSKVHSDASAISEDYAALVALSIRQALGATEITISKNSDGSWNTQDVLMFMKEISSDGNTNTVDVIFPASPTFFYLQPTWMKYLLDALFQYQATGQYPNKFSVHDLGANYPKAIGHNDGKDEPMPVEESGNMVIMALLYAQKSGDNSQLTKYGTLLDQWTQFLIEDSLIPAHQLSTDDFAGSLANQTNLAIKGIVGIKAMAKIAQILGDSDKSGNYSAIAASYLTSWQQLATAPSGDHLTLSYGDATSWGLAYNLLADKLLGLHLFPSSIFDMQTAWYQKVANAFGVPLDTRHSYTKSDWSIWTAGLVTQTAVRDLLISSVKKYAADGQSSQPLGDWYETVDGKVESFKARPVVGGHLALMILPSSSNNVSNNSTNSDIDPQDSSGRGRTVSVCLALSVVVSAWLL